MPQLTTQQRVWICSEMAREDSPTRVTCNWLQHFPGVPQQSLKAIKKNYEKYRQHGTSLNKNKGNSGRPRTALSQQNIQMVRQSLFQSEHLSSRQNALQLSRMSFWRITSEEIHFNPYRLIRRQKLNQGDPPKRLAFCNWLVNITQNDPAFLDHLITSDEAVFSLNSEVNTHHVICYAPYGHGHPQGHYVD